jgi:hypothetical protein
MNSPLPFVSRGAKAWGMARRHSPRHPLFRQRWFADDIIITCVRWYLRFKLSYRDLAELVRELGVCVAPSTILRWVIRYVPEFEKCWQAHERPVGDSWRVDETYLKVRGRGSTSTALSINRAKRSNLTSVAPVALPPRRRSSVKPFAVTVTHG